MSKNSPILSILDSLFLRPKVQVYARASSCASFSRTKIGLSVYWHFMTSSLTESQIRKSFVMQNHFLGPETLKKRLPIKTFAFWYTYWQISCWTIDQCTMYNWQSLYGQNVDVQISSLGIYPKGRMLNGQMSFWVNGTNILTDKYSNGRM